LTAGAAGTMELISSELAVVNPEADAAKSDTQANKFLIVIFLQRKSCRPE
jgi:hypothetical protein